MLSWASQFNICCLLDNHQYQTSYNSVECLLAVHAFSIFKTNNNTLEKFKQYQQSTNDWLFGHVSYDFKNELHGLTSSHPDGIQFPDFFFFQPETVIKLSQESVEISCIKSIPESVFMEIGLISNEQLTIDNVQQTSKPKLQTIIQEQRATNDDQQNTRNEHLSTKSITPRIAKENYLQIIEQLKKHIRRGDCYEINFCQEFYATNTCIHPLEVYRKLVQISPNPFSAYYKLDHHFLMCASPERYIKKQDSQIISQPIKGTFKRNTENTELDLANKNALQNSNKDKAENVMVVDLVRNDLSKICTEGSVKVEELFGVYTFPQVYQMISTISGIIDETIEFTDVLAATFPMGSMTGAPKKRVMELTEQYEQTKRGIYSGCVGYITPNGNFDFNVVIRSIMYNAKNQYLSYQVGGGITYNSNAESEYEECLLKAEAIMKVLE